MSVVVNHAGVSHARNLIRSGSVVHSESWSGSTAEKENEYLKDHSMAEYGKWFLGLHSDVPADTKGHYCYPFSSDFEHVDIKGLHAAKSRAAQQGATGVEKAADSLIGHNEKKAQGRELDAEYHSSHYINPNNGNITFRLQKVDNVDWNNNMGVNW
jgi:hypothetical protein